MTKYIVHLNIEGTIETDEGAPIASEEFLHRLSKGLAVLQPDGEDFAKQLRRRRLNKGLSPPKLSKLSGVSTSHIYRIERGERSPSYQIVLKLEKALEETAND